MGDNQQLAAEIARVAARQYGHITRRQLLAFGAVDRSIRYRIATGTLVRVHAGVYAVGYRRVEPVARAAAAVLACGPGTVLSHESAAALWGLRRWPRVPEVLAVEQRRRPGIHTHRSRTLGSADVRVELGIRTTNAARAIADIQSRLTDHQLVRATQDARLGAHLSTSDLVRLLRRCPRLRELIDPAENPTRSGLEDTLLPWLRSHGLPLPRINAHINGYEVDALYPRQKVIIELDSWRYHRDRPIFLSDRARDSHHLSHGYVTVRLVSERLTDEEALRLQLILARRGPEKSQRPSDDMSA